MKKRETCSCCGCFVHRADFCQQCLHAGCDKKKKGERCYLATGAARPKPHSQPPVRTDAVGPDDGSGRGKISFEGRTF
jgi:hypothetical protein